MREGQSLCKVRTSIVVDLPSVRRNAAAFIDNSLIADVYSEGGWQPWVTTWTRIGDGYRFQADLMMASGALDQASEALLCALTAFELARQLLDQSSPARGEITSKIEACTQQFGQCRRRPAEWIRIGCSDHWGVSAFFLPADGPERSAPSVICISEDDEAIEALVGKLLPGLADRGVSILVVSGADISSHPVFERDLLLGFCLDYLVGRADVDSERVAVYGEKFAAVHATNFAASNHRIAAAVCDGGVWRSTRMQGSIEWMAGAERTTDDASATSYRLQAMRRLKCPILVTAGERGLVSVPEAIRLQADCMAAGIDLDVVIPRTIETARGAIENFITTYDFVFGWLERKLGARRQLRTITHL
jgi:hypothetical protein